MMSLGLSLPGHHATSPAGCGTGGLAGTTLAEQEAVVPVYWPLHVPVQAPELVTEEATPAEHRLALGAVANEPPFAVPHTPLIGEGVPVVNVDCTPLKQA